MGKKLLIFGISIALILLAVGLLHQYPVSKPNCSNILVHADSPNINLKVYPNDPSNGSVNELTSINWSETSPLSLGSTTNYWIYERNEGQASFTQTLSTANWTFKDENDTQIYGYDSYFNLTWDYKNTTVFANQIKPIKLSLTVSSNLCNVSTFEFYMIITVTSLETEPWWTEWSWWGGWWIVSIIASAVIVMLRKFKITNVHLIILTTIVIEDILLRIAPIGIFSYLLNQTVLVAFCFSLIMDTLAHSYGNFETHYVLKRFGLAVFYNSIWYVLFLVPFVGIALAIAFHFLVDELWLKRLKGVSRAGKR